MIEAAKIWNEPNNKSHWDPEIDPGWEKFAAMATAAGRAIREAHPTLPRVLGGISPIDPAFIRNMQSAACSTMSMRSRSMVFRSTGICGRSTNGRRGSPKSRRW
jgi:beta-xylosidase